MSDQYAIFRKFPTWAQAEEMRELLEEEGLDCRIGDNIPPFDITFSGSTLLHEYEIRLHPSDFDKAHEVLDEWADNLLYDVDPEHFLFQYSDSELYEILLKPDEWSPQDYALTRKILQQRGVVIDDQLLKSIRIRRLEELSQPEGNQSDWIIAGYVLAVLGAVFGVLIGYFLWTSRKTLPNGQRVPSYSRSDRRHGKRMFILSIILLPVYIVLRYLLLVNP